ncbi:MAG: 50S ribosomal protein L22 [Candidatus Geothermincolia bacterium]
MAEAAERLEVRAQAKFVRIGPQKARQMLDLIRGKDVEEARRILRFTPKHAAELILKTLDSAVANAENNNGLRADDLLVAKAYADEGPTLKRWRPRAYGRASRINKRTSHITVAVSERAMPVVEPATRRKRKKG